MNRSYEAIRAKISKEPVRLGASDIANSVEVFVTQDGAILALAGRYDGLDLPGDQCRLLLMTESPAATNALERHLRDRWKLGPVFRKRERTRLIQGMGRCTRSATDFAVIIWLGQSLANAATSTALLGGMPSELAGEIKWGLEQSQLAANRADDLVKMILGLLEDPDYRRAANDEISALEPQAVQTQPEEYEKLGSAEVRFAKAIWDEDYKRALDTARTIADQVTANELAGYRAWWWYLAALAASLGKQTTVEQDALRRGSMCGINSGWLNRLLQSRIGATPSTASDEFESNAEGVWDLLENWGWAGPGFEERIQKMLLQLGDLHHVAFHEGLEALGKCLGAQTTRITEPGVPDVVWSFGDDTHFAFEAKTEKRADGTLSKKDLLNAKGHSDWVRARLCGGRSGATIEPIIVSIHAEVHQVGLPFTGGLYQVSPDLIVKWAQEVAEKLRQLRIKYSGREFPSAATELSFDLRGVGMDMKSIRTALTSAPLKT